MPHNLPIQLTKFIGQQRESAEITRLLINTRLLALTGPGGCGKTRLALPVAETVREGTTINIGAYDDVGDCDFSKPFSFNRSTKACQINLREQMALLYSAQNNLSDFVQIRKF